MEQKTGLRIAVGGVSEGAKFTTGDSFGDGERVTSQHIDVLVDVRIQMRKGRASDAVVGQILRYMGYVAEELAEEGQTVRGVIIALDDDHRIRRALTVSPNVSFYQYQGSFKLQKS
jgi:RecB family endonuclease NucS